MSNNKDTVRALVFIALAGLMVGTVAVTVIVYSTQAEARPDRAFTCPSKSPGAGFAPPCGQDRVAVPR